MKPLIFTTLLGLVSTGCNASSPSDYVNPFIGTSNYGATHPGAQYPHGLASVSPFNVAYQQGGLNKFEKDAAWNSRVYIHENQFLTGFSHLNLSGVGCPDAGSILLMPTRGRLELNPEQYGSTYSDEQASPGYYRTRLDKHQVQVEVTSTLRTGLSRYTFAEGESHILFDLGLALSNETGGSLRIVSAQEIEGMRTIGTFCYNPQDVRPLYFVARLNKAADDYGAYKKMPAYQGVEANWVGYNDAIKPYPGYPHPIAGDDIGAYFSFKTDKDEQIEVKVGISFVSIENARANLDKEQPGYEFDKIRKAAEAAWNEKLSRIDVEGSEQNKTLFYSALYHSLIHPNIIQDVNGDYPLMGQQGFGNSGHKNRYSVFSLWDTHRSVHPLLSLVYPELQSEMVNTMVDMYKEAGWLPKWELYGMETQVMVGDPASIVVADTYMRGIRDFDVQAAYEAMKKSSNSAENNPLRPENSDYLNLGYVPVDDEGPFYGSVSTSLEYYLADFNIGRLAEALGKPEEAQVFFDRSQGYKKLFDAETGMLRPRRRDGSWLTPYDQELGRNFEPAPGYIEGNAWNYRFYVPHDIPGLIELLGGQANFLEQLNKTFTTNNYDMANEPDITYPFLFNYIEDENLTRTSNKVSELIEQHYKNEPAGLPGNDDAGTLSAWLVFSMMGFYPTAPGIMDYALFTPMLDTISIKLNPDYYSAEQLIIKNNNQDKTEAGFYLNGKRLKVPFISHTELTSGNP